MSMGWQVKSLCEELMMVSLISVASAHYPRSLQQGLVRWKRIVVLQPWSMNLQVRKMQIALQPSTKLSTVQKRLLMTSLFQLASNRINSSMQAASSRFVSTTIQRRTLSRIFKLVMAFSLRQLDLCLSRITCSSTWVNPTSWQTSASQTKKLFKNTPAIT